MVSRGEFYAGSQLLMPLVPIFGLPLDQVNFLVCQIVALILAVLFRKVLSPESTSSSVRLVVELVAGVALSFFCFGYQVCYLMGQSFFSYLVMRFITPQWSHKVVFVFCMVYLAIAHISRQIYDYGGYTLDITGPMMIQTQKLTSMAFALVDGHLQDRKPLTPDQKSQAISEVPDLLRFYSYMFYFHGIMCGPLAFYSDYMAFIDGSSFTKYKSSSLYSDPMSNHTVIFIKRFILACVCGLLMVTLPPVFCPPEGMRNAEFFEKTILQKTAYIIVCLTLSRQKYYFAWTLGETINIAAGYGFDGYDSDGKPKWDLVDNVDMWAVEFADSLKVNIDGWNKKTLVWLRRVVYDRASKHQTLAVFAVSAFWHGFYPGYYLTFGTAALFTVSARLVRRHVRPFFQQREFSKKVYNAITFVFTRIANVYITFPFVTLELVPSLQIYLSMYFWLHIAAVSVIVCYYLLAPLRKSKQLEKVD